MVSVQCTGNFCQIGNTVVTGWQGFDQHFQYAAARQCYIRLQTPFTITDHLAGRLIFPGRHAPQKILFHAATRQRTTVMPILGGHQQRSWRSR
ncbi:hypothetical protein D3C80_1709850 [compost metagenome]